MFAYVFDDGRGHSVGLVLANDINEADTILRDCFKLENVRIKEIEFNSDGICELYYGS